jgi:hypothetical protein
MYWVKIYALSEQMMSFLPCRITVPMLALSSAMAGVQMVRLFVPTTDMNLI